MGKIVAIGGGEIGRPGFSIETTKIDKEIIKLSGKLNPRLLFIPTASNDSPAYIETAKKYFGEKLKCSFDVLCLTNNKQTKEDIESKILNSDIIYVGGGNTLKMISLWKKLGIDKILVKAYKKGIVMSGLSAGAICWFKFGNSKKENEEKIRFIKIKCLGIFDFILCPHYNEKLRDESLKKMIKYKETAIALDNCAALAIINDKYKIITSKKEANAYVIYKQNGKFHKKILASQKIFTPIQHIKE